MTANEKNEAAGKPASQNPFDIFIAGVRKGLNIVLTACCPMC